ncbi:MAG TPA: cadherin domain-containing protein [Burkholderiales bacterium]|nr:cadherin domain-containing protein [Burkholderiales bacterium]
MATINGTQYDDVIKSSGSTYNNGKKTGSLGNSTNDADIISAGAGNDLIYAGGGADTISGGNGNDTIYGEAGNDIIWGDTFGNPNANDNGQDRLFGGTGNDEIHGGNAKDEIDGGADNDTLYGDNGVDVIKGGAGDDLFNGGNGGDVLIADGGADTIVYTTNTSSAVSDSPYALGEPGTYTEGSTWAKSWDVIREFTPGTDKIDLSGLPLTGTGATPLVWRGAQGSDADAGTARAAFAHGVWTDADGNFLYADINGDGKADLKVQVSGVGLGDLVGVQENDAPTITSGDSASVPENTVAVVYDANATDPEGDAISYSVTGIDAALFAIDSDDGELRFVGSPNFEAPADSGGDNVYNLTVVASDGFISSSQAVAITVTDENETPTDITFTGGTVAENAADGTLVATAAGVDPDAGGGNDGANVFENLSYTLTDNAGGRFAIDIVSGAITVLDGSLLDYETDTSHTVTVRATDGGGLFYDENLVISVTDVVESQGPTDIDLSVTSVQENSLNVLLGTLSTVDPDDTSGFTYTLLDNAGGRFELLNGNEIHVARGDLLDYEVATSHDITVQVVDPDSASYTETITIDITDMLSVGSFTDGPPTSIDIVDGTSSGDNLNGGGLADRLYGGQGNDILNGENGADALFGQGGDDSLIGDQNDDIVLDGGSGADSLLGGQGVDVLVGGTGADIMDGGGQVDRFIWRAEDLGTGIDQINNLETTTGQADILQIGDVLTGYSGGSTAGFLQVIDGGGGNALVQVDPNGGSSWTTLVQLNGTTAASVTASVFDLATYTRTDHVG